MNSENENTSDILIPDEYQSVEDKGTYIAGYLGFGVNYLIKCVQLDKDMIKEQFISETGSYYDIWLHGHFVALTELRKIIMQSALNASTPAIEKMLLYFANTNNEIEHLE